MKGSGLGAVVLTSGVRVETPLNEGLQAEPRRCPGMPGAHQSLGSTSLKEAEAASDGKGNREVYPEVASLAKGV